MIACLAVGCSNKSEKKNYNRIVFGRSTKKKRNELTEAVGIKRIETFRVLLSANLPKR